MARVLKPAHRVVAVHTHTCGALVEFEKSDIVGDRDGDYVICPACHLSFSFKLLKWTDEHEEKK